VGCCDAACRTAGPLLVWLLLLLLRLLAPVRQPVRGLAVRNGGSGVYRCVMSVYASVIRRQGPP